jgi:hypothetical protein
MEFSLTEQEKCDLLIQVTAWLYLRIVVKHYYMEISWKLTVIEFLE